MKHLFTGVALAALVGLAPLALAQTATTGTRPGVSNTTTQGSDMTGSAGNRGAAEGTKATTGNATAGGNAGSSTSSMGTGHSGSMGASGMSSDHMSSKKNARHSTSSAGSSSMAGRSQDRDADTTRQLNQQELSRLRSGGG